MYNKQAVSSFGSKVGVITTPKASVNFQSSPMSRNRRNTVAAVTKSKTLENFDNQMNPPSTGSNQGNF
jgi:hypothetical protein